MPDENHTQWGRVDKDEFERYANALLVRAHQDDPDHEPWVPDGRGGDRGVDVGVRRRSDKVVERIYQLKYFPDGFAGDRKSVRQREVRKSWATAVKEHPFLKVWVLVAPASLTPGEREYVEGLRSGQEPAIEIVGPPELDILLARFPDIHDFITRRPVEDAMRRIGQEHAAISNVNDVTSRASDLAKAGNALSLHWEVRTATTDGTAYPIFVPKTADAAEKEPIELRAQLRFDEDQRDLQKAYRSAVKYGSIEPVVLGSDVVGSIEVASPDWAKTALPPGELHVGGADKSATISVIVQAVTSKGVVRASLPMVIDGRSPGQEGGTLHFVFHACFEITMVMRAKKLTGKVKMATNWFGKPASDALQVLRFLEALDRTRLLVVVIPDVKPTPMPLDKKMKFGQIVVPDLREFIDDLACLERELGVTFPVPTSATRADHAMVRFARRITEGRIVMHPFVDGLNVTLSGLLDEGLVSLLTGAHQIVATDRDFTFDLLGQQVSLGEVTLYSPSTEVADGAAHLTALRAGAGEDRVIHVKQSENSGFVAFSLPRLANPDAVAKPEPFGLVNGWEHRNLKTVQDQVQLVARNVPDHRDEDDESAVDCEAE